MKQNAGQPPFRRLLITAEDRPVALWHHGAPALGAAAPQPSSQKLSLRTRATVRGSRFHRRTEGREGTRGPALGFALAPANPKRPFKAFGCAPNSKNLADLPSSCPPCESRRFRQGRSERRQPETCHSVRPTDRKLASATGC